MASFLTSWKCCCHPPGNIHWYACVFFFTKDHFFFVEVLLLFVCTIFSIHFHLKHTKEFKQKNSYIITKIENFKLCFDRRNINLFLYNKSQLRSFLIQLETTMQRLRRFDWKIICDENFKEKCWKGFFYYCQDLKTSWLENFSKFNKRGVWNKNVLSGKFSKKW